MMDLPSRLTLDQAAEVLGTDLSGVRHLIATGKVEVHQICSGRCETLVGRDSLLTFHHLRRSPSP